MAIKSPDIDEIILEFDETRILFAEEEEEEEEVRIVVSLKDITERNQAEKTLKESENKYRELYDEAPVGYHEIDLEGRLTRVNKTEAELLGYAPEEMIGRYVWEFIAPDQRELSRKSFKTKIEQKKTGESFERKYICKNGKKIDVYITDRLILDKSGNLAGIRSTLENITARRQAEETLRRNHAMLARTESITHVGSWEWDVATDTVKWSDELFRIFQRNPADRAPSFAEHPELYYPEDMQRLRDAVEAALSNGTPYEIELRAFRKDGETRVCLARGHAEMGPEKRATRLFGSLQDITERKRAEEALRQAEEKYRSIFENVVEGIFQTTPEGRFLTVNPALARIYGYSSPEELIETITDIGRQVYVNPDERNEFLRILQEKGKITGFELQLKKKDGSTFWASINARAVYDENGNILYHAGTSENITERKLAEEALKESEERFRQLSEASFEGITVHDQGILLRANDQFFKMFGYEPDELLGKETINKLIAPESRKLMWNRIRKGSAEIYEAIGVRKDGTEFSLELHPRQIEYKGRNVRVVAIRDITERKRAEEELRREKEVLHTILDNIPVMVAFLNPDGHHKWVNKCWQATLGWSLQEALETDLLAEVYPDPEYRKYVVDFISSAESTWREFRTRIREGRVLDTLWANIPLSDGSNIGIGIDITVRKLAEEALKESEDKFRRLAESIKDVFFALDCNLKYTYWNKASEELTGIPAQQALGKSIYEIFTEIRGTELEKMYLEVIEKQEFNSMENLFPIGSRNYVFQINAYPTINGLTVIAKDITTSKRAEEELRESEKKYRLLSENLNEGVWCLNKDAYTIFVNQRTADMLGYTIDEMSGKHLFEFMDERGIEIAQRNLEHRQQGIKEQHDFKFLRKDGTYIWTMLETGPITDKQGNYDGAIAGMLDITERKQVEEALLKERNFVSTVLDTAPALVVVLDVQGRIVRFNHAAEHLTGYKFSEVEGKYFWDLFEPSKFPHKIEEYWLTKDGERRLIAWSNSFILDKEGWVEYYISIGIDVTERKKVEQKLLKSQKELRSLSAYLQNVREDERKHISREIHDELGQTLTALKIDLAMLAESIPEKQKNLLDQTKSIMELIDTSLTTVKKISSDLRPGLLDDFGIVPAIEWQTSEFTKRTGTKCLLSFPDEEIKIDQEHSTAIFRIFQEILTNITRHARATEVRISVSETDREIRLTVKDNGIGIEEKDISSSSSLGLIGIRERAQFFKGRVTIRSERNKGTTLKVSIPYPKEGS